MLPRSINPEPLKAGRAKLLALLVMASVCAQSQVKTSGTQKENPDFLNQPALSWKFTCKDSFFASPVVSNSTVYIGGLDSILHAIDLLTGSEKWSFRTKGEIRSNVCIAGERIFLNGGDGLLYALDRKTGRIIWTFSTGGEKKYDFADYFHSTPVFNKGNVFFGSGDEHLYAVNAEDGKLIWKYKTTGIVHTTPSIDNDKIFFGSFDGYVYALNLYDGNLVWKFKTVGHRYFPKGEVQGSPAAFNNLVIIGARDYNVYAIDQTKGFCHWNKAFTMGWGLNNNIHDSTLFIGSSDERVLIAADPATGKEFWKVKMEFLVFGNNGYSDSLMYIGTTNGKLHAISLKSGKKVWSFETDSYRKNRLKYFKTDDSYRDDIYSIIKSNEEFLDAECDLGGIFSTPVVTLDRIIFSSTEGSLYCLTRTP